MQIGDLVQVTGKVKDIVDQNVLMGTDPDGREYWFLAQHVALQSVLTTAEEAEAHKEAAAASVTTTTTKTAATTHSTHK